jgi:hypothetical protein
VAECVTSCQERPGVTPLINPVANGGRPLGGNERPQSRKEPHERHRAIRFLVVLGWKQADRNEVVERIATGKRARTCLFDEQSGRLYVPVPRQKGKDGPELRVFQARP